MVNGFLKPYRCEKSAVIEAIPFPCSTMGCFCNWESLLNSIVVIINLVAKLIIKEKKVKRL